MYSLDEIRRLVSLEQAGRVVVSPWQRETHPDSRPIEGEGAIVFGNSYWVDTARGQDQVAYHLAGALEKVSAVLIESRGVTDKGPISSQVRLKACKAILFPMLVNSDHWVAVGVFPGASTILVADSARQAANQRRIRSAMDIAKKCVCTLCPNAAPCVLMQYRTQASSSWRPVGGPLPRRSPAEGTIQRLWSVLFAVLA